MTDQTPIRKLRFVKEATSDGAWNFYTEEYQPARVLFQLCIPAAWLFVAGSMFRDPALARAFYERELSGQPVLEKKVLLESWKSDPVLELTECMEVNFRVTYRVNYKRPMDEAPEVYDVTIHEICDDQCKAGALEYIRASLVEKLWDAEVRERVERDQAHREGPEYEPEEQEAGR